VALEPKHLILNSVAGLTPVRDRLRRFRDRNRDPNYPGIVDYTLERLRVRREFIGDERIRDASLLEIGSGPEFCLALLLLSIGANRVVNVEIEPYGFIDDPELYRLLVTKANEAGFLLSWPPPGLRLEDGGRRAVVDPSRIDLHLGCSAASIPQPDCAFDVTFSVAVLEHVRSGDMPAVARELHRLTKPGGVGFHRVDLVDHYYRRTEPFRFLRYSQREYDMMFGRRGSSSNRMRMDDHVRAFRSAGFAQVGEADVRPYQNRNEFGMWTKRFHKDFTGKDPEVLRVIEFMLTLTR
jgi:SAM-dependent methyltransferase